ncbi:MAG TPA: amino acid ABC transporter permease [Amycolatopsis sp.]|jgi:His/Glu/Gln/Arg/opine family amino acid ABC transporter permease subunit|nr:amino acid ABC transporter permease [Amycolatopsis sp.]
MNAIGENLPFLLGGFVLTLGYAAGALVIAMVLGGVLGTADYAVAHRPVRWAIRGFVGLFRNTPFIVQLYIWFFGLPYVGVQLSPAAASLAGLGLYGAGYVTEIVRAALAGVGTEQEEAALSVGLTHWDLTLRVVWPQGFPAMVPALTNEAVALVKNTSLLGFITVTELTLRTQQAISSTFASLPLYLTAGVLYLVVNVLLTVLARRMETVLARRRRGSALNRGRTSRTETANA